MWTKTASSWKRSARESTLRSDIQRHFVLERLRISWSRGVPCAAPDVATAANATSALKMLDLIRRTSISESQLVPVLHGFYRDGAGYCMTIQRIRGTILQREDEAWSLGKSLLGGSRAVSWKTGLSRSPRASSFTALPRRLDRSTPSARCVSASSLRDARRWASARTGIAM